MFVILLTGSVTQLSTNDLGTSEDNVKPSTGSNELGLNTDNYASYLDDSYLDKLGSQIDTYDNHQPIVIDGNTDLENQATNEGWSGTGTENDPYVISGYNITADASTKAIELSNINHHLLLHNNLIQNASHGMYVQNTQNIHITNNTILDNQVGLYLISGTTGIADRNLVMRSERINSVSYKGAVVASDIVIEDNFVNATYRGIYLSGSTATHTVRNNWINNTNEAMGVKGTFSSDVFNNPISYSSDGIRLEISTASGEFSNNTLINNTRGLTVADSSTDNIFANNSIVGYNPDRTKGMFIIDGHNYYRNNTLIDAPVHITESDDYTDFIQYEFADNTYNSKPIVYWQHQTGGTISQDAGQVIVINSTNVKVEAMELSNTGVGLFLGNTNHTQISDLYLYNNLKGIFNVLSHNNLMENNTFDSNYNGFEFKFSNDTFIRDNLFIDNFIGAEPRYSYNNTITANRFSTNDMAISLIRSSQSIISHNILTDHLTGILFQLYSSNNSLHNNSLITNRDYALKLGSTTANNTVTYNDFITEQSSPSQASDAGQNNSIEYNHWSEFTTPDDDNDGLVDNPYPIDGSNEDPYPLTEPLFGPSAPVIIHPYDFEVFGPSTIVIEWLESIDPLGRTLTYMVEYSYNGSSWTEISTGLSNTSYGWDISSLQEGFYKLRVTAQTDDGTTVTSTMDNPFQLKQLSTVTETTTSVVTTTSETTTTVVSTSTSNSTVTTTVVSTWVTTVNQTEVSTTSLSNETTITFTQTVVNNYTTISSGEAITITETTPISIAIVVLGIVPAMIVHLRMRKS